MGGWIYRFHLAKILKEGHNVCGIDNFDKYYSIKRTKELIKNKNLTIKDGYRKRRKFQKN